MNNASADLHLAKSLHDKALRSAAGLDSLSGVLDGAAALSGDWPAKAHAWAAELHARADSRRARRFKILVMGEFKRGKSTLINALLGARVLPQKPTPCTSVISTVVYGPQPEVTVLYQDGNRQTMTPEDFERDFALKPEDTAQGNAAEDDFASGDDAESAQEEEARYDRIVRDRFGSVESALIAYPADICQDGVEIVDSPGLSEHPDREARTLKQVSDADAVIVVLSATQFLNGRERRIIARRLTPFRDQHKLFFAINRWNQILESVVDPEDADEVREVFAEQEKLIDLMLRPLLGQVANDRIFRINALGALQWRRKPATPEVFEKTGLPAMLASMRQFLAHDRERAEQASDQLLLRNIVGEVTRHSRLELRSLHTSIAELEAEYVASQPLFNQLRASRDHVQTLIKASAAELVHDLCESLDEYFRTEIEPQLKDAVSGFDLGPAGKALKRLSAIFDRWRDDDDKVATQISKHLSETIGGFLQPKITEWWDLGARSVIRQNLAKLSAALEKETVGYGRTLDEITRSSGGGNALEGIIKRAFQKLNPRGSDEVSNLGFDLSALIGSIIADLVAHTAFHATLTATLPGVGLLISAIMLVLRAKKVREKTRADILESLRSGLPRLAINIHEDLRRRGRTELPPGSTPETIHEAFDLATREINSGVDQQISQLDATMRSLLKRKEQGEADNAKRQKELEGFVTTFSKAADELTFSLGQ
jgi:GTPase SAR1 family protein